MTGKPYHRWILAALATLALAGGSQAAEPPSFGGYLAQGYREIALYALNRIASPAVAAHFASRAEMTEVRGAAIEPEAIGDWEIGRKLAIEARSARRQLMSRLGNDARWTSPLTSAIAVLNFDCWLGFASADPSSSTECRRRFFAALQSLPAHRSSAPAIVPAGAPTIVIALQACAAPPWLGDCPMPPDAQGSPGLESPVERHAAGETTGRRAISALAAADSPTAISALADVAPDPSLAELVGPASAAAPAD